MQSTEQLDNQYAVTTHPETHGTLDWRLLPFVIWIASSSVAAFDQSPRFFAMSFGTALSEKISLAVMAGYLLSSIVLLLLNHFRNPVLHRIAVGISLPVVAISIFGVYCATVGFSKMTLVDGGYAFVYHSVCFVLFSSSLCASLILMLLPPTVTANNIHKEPRVSRGHST